MTSPACVIFFAKLEKMSYGICYCLLSSRQQRKLIMRLSNGEFALVHVLKQALSRGPLHTSSIIRNQLMLQFIIN